MATLQRKSQRVSDSDSLGEALLFGLSPKLKRSELNMTDIKESPTLPTLNE